MLLDGNGLIYRGYFALPPLSTAKGELVNAVFGFTSILLRGFQDVKPDYVAVAFDLPGPTFRHEEYREYKATRKPMPDDLRSQFPKVREVVAALRIPVLELAGYEADDVIGTLTLQAEARGVDSTIVTGASFGPLAGAPSSLIFLRRSASGLTVRSSASAMK